MKVKYRRISVEVPDSARGGICEACGHTGKTDLHHIIYQYSTKEVRENPKLALEGTVELCYRCHRIANAIQLIRAGDDEKVPDRVKKVCRCLTAGIYCEQLDKLRFFL